LHTTRELQTKERTELYKRKKTFNDTRRGERDVSKVLPPRLQNFPTQIKIWVCISKAYPQKQTHTHEEGEVVHMSNNKNRTLFLIQIRSSSKEQ
jgi:hypothetical protein